MRIDGFMSPPATLMKRSFLTASIWEVTGFDFRYSIFASAVSAVWDLRVRSPITMMSGFLAATSSQLTCGHSSRWSE